VIAIARYTIAETLRRRVLWVLFVVTLLVIGLTPLGVARLASLARDAGAGVATVDSLVAQGLIFVAFEASFVIALTAAFVGAPAISTEVRTGAAAVMLTRPILRSAYLLGRWAGLATVLVVEAIVVGVLSIATTALATGYAPPAPVLPVVFLAGQALLVMTLAITLSARFTTAIAGTMAMFGYAVAWLGGVLGSIGGGETGAAVIGRLVGIVFPSDTLWRGILFGLEPPAFMAVSGSDGNPFSVAAPPDPFLIAWAAFWVLLALWQAIAFLRRREL
jgi:ABC-type transport system involved in multi-copper enzyme maturation permease subunit